MNDESVQIWDRNADYWDQRMGEGNDFHKLLIEPTQIRLLELQGGEMVLDVACGNGQFARKMADLGANIVAVDASEKMLQKAKARSTDYADRIEYRVVDCTDTAQLASLGERQFDRITCTMALMDICEIRPLASMVARLLKPGGHFLFSVLHPCFNSGLSRQVMERHDLGGDLVEEYFVRVCDYADPRTDKGVAMPGQPLPQYYFHRSLTILLNSFFAEGLVLDGLKEPTFGANANETKLFDMVYQKIPPALVARLRLAAEHS